MEFNSNKSHNSFGHVDSSLNKGNEKKVFSFIKKAFDSQLFFNSRLKALEFFERHQNLTTAMLTMHIAKVKGFLGTNYEVKFSSIYSRSDGSIIESKDFYKVELPGKEGMIPSYILKALDEEESIEIKFNSKDLTVLHEEESTKIDEESTFDEIIDLCKQKNVSHIELIDRVFYTRVECFDTTNDCVGVIHVGSLHDVPKTLRQTLYPCGQATFDVK